MKANVGSIDRIVRIIVGLAVLSLFFILEGNAKYLGLIGVVLIGTGFVSFCPLYAMLGLSTRGQPAKHA